MVVDGGNDFPALERGEAEWYGGMLRRYFNSNGKVGGVETDFEVRSGEE